MIYLGVFFEEGDHLHGSTKKPDWVIQFAIGALTDLINSEPNLKIAI